MTVNICTYTKLRVVI